MLYTWTHVGLCMYTRVCVCVEAGGQCRSLLLLLSDLCLNQDFSLNLVLTTQIDCLAHGPQGPIFFTSPVLPSTSSIGKSSCLVGAALYGCWGPNSGPYACQASTYQLGYLLLVFRSQQQDKFAFFVVRLPFGVTLCSLCLYILACKAVSQNISLYFVALLTSTNSCVIWPY